MIRKGMLRYGYDMMMTEKYGLANCAFLYPELTNAAKLFLITAICLSYDYVGALIEVIYQFIPNLQRCITVGTS